MLTGGFALATAVDSSVLASVMSQPAVPFPLGKTRSADPGLSQTELGQIVERTANDGLCVMGLRFSEDASVPAARFAGLKARLGDAFEVIQIDSSDGNAGGFAKGAHSVLTGEVREDPANEAFDARTRVVEFLHAQLSTAAS